jgi:hypothetical protein
VQTSPAIRFQQANYLELAVNELERQTSPAIRFQQANYLELAVNELERRVRRLDRQLNKSSAACSSSLCGREDLRAGM